MAFWNPKEYTIWLGESEPSIWVSAPICRKVLMPAICMPELVTVPDDLSTAFDFILYKGAEEAVIKVLGAN